jgi:hypothetical protein
MLDTSERAISPTTLATVLLGAAEGGEAGDEHAANGIPRSVSAAHINTHFGDWKSWNPAGRKPIGLAPRMALPPRAILPVRK